MDHSRAARTTGTFYPEFKFPPLAGTQPRASPFTLGSTTSYSLPSFSPIPQPPSNLSNPVAKEDGGTVPVTQQIKKLSLTSSQSCGQCQSVNAVSFCSKCQSFLCELCNDAHKRMATFKGHTPVHPDQAIELSAKNCPKHPNEVFVNYCTACKNLVCQDCILFSCYEHISKPLDIATADIKAHLKSDFEYLRAHLQSFRPRAVIIAQVEKHVTTYPDKIKSFITEKQQDEKHKKELIKQVDTHYNDFSKALNTEKDNVRKAVATIEAGIKSAHQLLTRKGVSNSEFAVLGNQALLSMQKAKTLSWDPNIENFGFLLYMKQSSFLSDRQNQIHYLANIETTLKLKAEGYYTSTAGHFSRIQKQDASLFLKNGLHCVYAEIYFRNKSYQQLSSEVLFPQLSISCLITGPSTLAIPCTIEYATTMLMPTQFQSLSSTLVQAWNIFYKTTEAGCFSFKVGLKLDGDIYYEITETLTFK